MPARETFSPERAAATVTVNAQTPARPPYRPVEMPAKQKPDTVTSDHDADDRSQRRSAAVSDDNPLLEPLEPRMLFSAEPFGYATDLFDPPYNEAIVDFPAQPAADELVFLNDNIGQIETLLADLHAQADSGRRVVVHVLDSGQSGIDQIGEILAAYGEFAAIHFVSHGNDTGVQLGGSWLDSASLDRHAGAIAQWQAHLEKDASLLMYGCDLAASEHGVALLTELANLTGASVAASDDATGHSALHSDWDLEYRSGDGQLVEPVFSDAAQDAWLDELATFTYRNGDTNGYSQAVDTHLSEAASSTGHGDEILLHASQVNGNANQLLLRFDGIVGDVAGSVPLGTTIASATLTLNIHSASELGSTASLYPMLQGWDDSASWSGFANGIATDGTQASPTPVATFAADTSGAITVDVTASVQAWLNGDANHGWVLSSDATGSDLQLHASESADVSARPLLTIVRSDALTVTTTADVDDAPDLGSVSALLANPGADGKISLREAVIATNNTGGPDTIYLPAGHYDLAISGDDDLAEQGDLDILDEVTIYGAGGGATIIDANSLDRHFDVSNDNGPARLNLNSLVLINGEQNTAGAILIQAGTSASLTDVMLADNTTSGSGNGGAINSAGTLVVDGGTFERNAADGKEGGAIYADGALTISNSRFSENTADHGGAIHYAGSSSFTVANSDFYTNTSTNHGGAIDANSGAITITRSSFHGNEAVKGGAINVDGSASTSISHATISNNYASDEGGGIRARGGSNTMEIQSSTIAFNDADKEGGGYDNNGDVLTNIGNSIFEGNTTGGTTPNTFRDTGNVNSDGYNIVSDNSSNFAQTGDLTGVSAQLQPLQYAPGSNVASHSLYADSPARDSGEPALSDVDGDGNPRVGVPDRGATESYSQLVAHTHAAPQIDGEIDAQWSRSATAHLIDYSGDVTTIPSNPGASWRAAWDSTSLYLLVEVSDNTPFDDSAAIWHDDSIAIYIDPNLSRGATYDGVDDTNFYIGRNDNALSMDNDPMALANVTVATVNSASGYVKEIAIPWSELGIVPSAGLQVGLELHLNDDADGGGNDTELAWADIEDRAYDKPASFGAIVLDTPVDSAGPDGLNHGISINSDGGNNTYFEAPASLMQGLGNHTVQTRFSTTVVNGLSVIPWIDGTAVSYFLTADMADGQVHTHTQIWNSDTGYRAAYLDGNLLWDETTPANIGKTVTSTQPLLIGQNRDAGGSFDPALFFSGTIHDVRIWNYALAASEVTDNLHRQFSSHSPPGELIANWRFDRLTGDANDRVVDLINPGVHDILVKRQAADGSIWLESIPSDVPSFDDNANSGDLVAHMSPTDADVTVESYTFSLVDDAYGRFAIEPDSGQLRVADSASIEGGGADSLHSVTIRVTDESGQSFDRALSIVSNPVNEAPTLTGVPVQNTVYYSDGDPVVLGAGLLPDDPELTTLGSYSGFEITLQRDGGANAEDVFSLGSYQSGPFIMFLDGDALVTIGNVVQNDGGRLQLQFNAAVAAEVVRDTVRAITYSNANDTGTARSIDLRWSLNDNNTGGVQGSGGALTSSQLQTVDIVPMHYQAVDDDLGAVLSGDTLSINHATLTANDTGAGIAAPFIVGTTSPSTGSLTDNADALDFNSAVGTSGSSTFDYLAGIGNSNVISQWPLAVDGSDEAERNSGTLYSNGPSTELQFDGDDYVELPDLDYPTDWTMTFDFKIDDLNNGRAETLFSHGEFTASNSLHIYIAANNHWNPLTQGQLVTHIKDSTDSDLGWTGYKVDLASFDDGQWHNYAIVVRQGIGTSIYIDGNVQDTSSATRGESAFNPSGPAYIGTGDQGGALGDYLASHKIAHLRLISGFDLAAIDANELNQYSSATATITVRNEENLIDFNDINVNEDETKLIDSGLLLTTDLDQGPELLTYEVRTPPSQGSLLLDGSALNLGDTFTQQQVNDLKLEYRHDGSETVTGDSIDLRVDDGEGSYTDFTLVASLTPLNDAPVISSIESAALDYREGDGGVAVSNSLVISDNDDTDFVTATVRIASGYENGADQLVFADTATINGVFDDTTGVLTLSRVAPADVATWQAALRNVQFRNDSDDPVSGTRSVEFSIGDGDDVSVVVSRDIGLVSANDRPVLGDAVLESIPEDTIEPPGATVASLFTATFSDPDSAFAGIAITGDATATEGSWRYSTDGGAGWLPIGTVTESSALVVDTAAMLRFVPQADYFGAVPRLTVLAIDDSYTGLFSSASGPVSVDVSSPAADAPFASVASDLTSRVAPIGPSDLSRGIELNMDGGNDAYLLADDGGALLGGLTAVTMEALFDIDSINTRNALISYSAVAGADTLKLLVRSNGVVDVGVLGHDVLSAPVPALVDGNVHSVAASWDSEGGQLRMYADGELVHSVSGIAAGQTLQSGGTLVLGMEQDMPGGGFETSEVLSGTLHDVRLWNVVRNAAEIEADHFYTLDTADLPDSLIANWQMDGFDVGGEVVEVVGGNNLSVAHASGSGFSASTPNGVFRVSEHAANGDWVGTVVGGAPYRGEDLILDGSFLSSQSGTDLVYLTGSTIGGSGGQWQVDSGSVKLIESWAGSPQGGPLVDLVGGVAGSISQNVDTEVGKTYQLGFVLSGNFNIAVEHELRVGTGAATTDITVHKPDHWAENNLLWESRSVSFVATSSSTNISFSSLSIAGTEGALIGDISVIEVNPAIDAILADNPSLTYNAGTNKFYLADATHTDWATAQSNAVATELNGVAGRLVTIRSDYENSVVRDLAASIGQNVYLGATDQTTEGQWFWHTGLADGEALWSGTAGGSAPNGVYTNWNAGEPNNYSIGEHHSVMFYTIGNGVWNDSRITDHSASVIEWDANEVLSKYDYSIQSDPASAFSIDSLTGELSVADISGIDYETSPSYNITVRVTDAAGEYYDETITIVVIDSTAPQLKGVESSTLNYTENDTPVAISPGVIVSDADSSTIESAVVRIRDGYYFPGDELQFSDYGPFVGSWDDVNGILTINGPATAADWQAALRLVAYVNNTDALADRDIFFDFTVTDGIEDSNTASRLGSVTAVNDAPVLGDGSFPVILEDSGSPPAELISDIFSGQFSDPDSTFAGVAIIANPGTVEGDWRYSVNGSPSWNDVGTVSPSASLMLKENDQLQFVPASDYYGSVPALSLYAVDSSYTGSWTADGAPAIGNVMIRGDGTPFALDTSQIQTRVLAVGPTGLSSGLSLNTDGGNDAYLTAADGSTLLGGLTALTIESQFSIDTPMAMNPLLSYATSAAANAILLAIDETGTLFAHIDDQRVDATGTYLSLLGGQRHVVSFSWDSQHGDYAFYVDGELVDSGSAYKAGYSVETGGVLVLGQDQDSPDGGYDADQQFQGSFYDIRLWSTVRTAAEIEANYQHKFHTDDLPDALLANWRMDNLNGVGQTIDIVGGSVLNTAHIAEAGFTSSSPILGLAVSEDATNGTILGSVSPHSPVGSEDLVTDGRFTHAGATGLLNFSTGETIGPGGAWTVDSGNVDLDARWPTTPLGGTLVDLNGGIAGSISQTLSTEVGKTYQVQFALTGNFTDGTTKSVLASAAGANTSITVNPKVGWSSTNLLWEQRAFEFTATAETTTLSFASVAPASGPYGPIIGDVRVTELPAAVAELLSDDASLSYDGSTGKFYRAVATPLEWTQARDAATGSELNGIAGQLLTVSSAYENSVARTLAQSVGSNVWLGGSDSDVEGHWYWYEGTGPAEQFWDGADAASGGVVSTGAYANWASGEPNNYADAEDHVVIRQSGDWLDYSGSSLYGYVIEWDANDVLSSHQFELLSDPSGAFDIDRLTGAIQLVDNTVLNYESATSYNIDVRVTDVRGESHDQTFTIEVVDVAAPVLAGIESTAMSYIENSGAVAISDSLTVTGNLQTASIAIAGGYVAGEDVLTFANTPTITHTWNDSSGVLTLNGTGTSAEWQLALRSVLFSNDSEDPVEGSRSIQFSADNNGELSGLQSRTITVSALNDAPQIFATTPLSVTEDDTNSSGKSVRDIFSNTFFDHDGDVIGIAVSGDASTTEGQWQYSTDSGAQWHPLGSVSETSAPLIGLDSLLRFVPAPDYHGAIPALTVYTVDDSAGPAVTMDDTIVPANVSVRGGASAYSFASELIDGTVTSVFDEPVNMGSLPASLTVIEDIATNLDFSAIVIDPRDHSGDLTLRFATSSAAMLAARSAPDLTVVGGGGSIEITATAAQLNTYLSDTTAIQYLHSIPNTNGSTADSLSITLQYGANSELLGNTVIHIDSVNDAPQTADSRLLIFEDTPYTLVPGDISFSDPADGDALLEIQIEQVPVNAQLLLNGAVVSDGDLISATDIADGKLEFHPGLNANGTDYDSFSYRVRDAGGVTNGGDDLSDSIAIVSIDVAPINDSPTFDVSPVSLMRGESIALTGQILAHDPDVDDADRIITVTSAPTQGSLQLSGVALAVNDTFSQADVDAGQLHYVHNGSVAQDDAIALSFSDLGPGATGLTLARILTVAVGETHPMANPDTATVNEGLSVDINILDNDTAADEPLDPSTVQLLQMPSHGSVSVDAGGVLRYQHNGAESTADALKYTVADTGGQTSDPVTVTIGIDAVNDAPDLHIAPVAIDLLGKHENYWQLSEHPDGGIIAIGSALGADDIARLLVSRFDSNGALETSFGSGGHVLLEAASLDATQEQIAYALQTLANGDILIAGQANEYAVVARLSSDGSLDNTFGDDGWARIDVGGSTESRIYDLIELPDQRVLLAGYTDSGSHTKLLVRLNTDGSLDTSFGSAGIVTDAAIDAASQLQLDASGRILVTAEQGGELQILRLLANGALDSGFDIDGVLSTGLQPGSESTRPMLLQGDGSIVIAGVVDNPGTNTIILKRFTESGALDTGFGVSGVAQLASMETVYAIASQSDGSIVVAGSHTQDGQHLIVARFNADGTRDPAFSDSGYFEYPLASSSWGTGLAIDASDRILLGGADTANAANWNGVLLRLLADGQMDLQFSQNSLPISTEQLPGTLLSPDLQIVDAELAAADNFAGSTLQLQRLGAADPADRFDSGNALLNPLIAGDDLVVNGTVVGTIVDNTAGSLLLQFNAAATGAAVNQVASSIAYTYSGDAPPPEVTLQWLFADGNNGAQGAGGERTTTGDVTVSLIAINDAPTLSISAGTITHTEAGVAVAIAPSLSIDDAEYDLLDSAAQTTVTLHRAGGASAQDLFVASGLLSPLQTGSELTDAGVRLGTIISNADGELQIRFDAGIDSAIISSALHQIAYQYDGDVPPAQVALQWQFTDGNTGAQGEGGVKTGTATSLVSIVATADAPQISSLPVDTLPYIHGAPAIAIGPAIELGDPDSATLSGASISIDNYEPGVDVLDIDASFVPGASWDATTGVLQLSGAADLASYQTALRTLQYYSVDQPLDAQSDRTIRVTVTDDTAASSDAAVVRVGLTVPEHPVTIETADLADRQFIEGSPPLLLVPDIVVTSLDLKDVVRATVQITNGNAGQDQLHFDPGHGLPGLWQANSTTLQFDGAADAASYQALLRSISYSNTSENPDLANRLISISLVSESGTSNQIDFNLQPLTVNDAPVATGGSLVLPGIGSQVLTVSDFGFADVHEGHDLQSVVIETLPAIGQLLLGGSPIVPGLEIDRQDIADGHLRYTVVNPDSANVLLEQFEYRVRDSGGVDNGGVDLSVDAGQFDISVAAGDSVTAQAPASPFQVVENSPAGTLVGALDTLEVEAMFSHLADGDFASADRPYPDVNRYDTAGTWLGSNPGSWQVVDGNVDLHGAYWDNGPDGGAPLELNGDTAGAIAQQIDTVPGEQYRIHFAMSGDFRDAPSDQPLRLLVGAGTVEFEIDVARSALWSAQALQWQSQALIFTATDTSTTISFRSLTPGSHGAIVADIEVIDSVRYELLNTEAPFEVDSTGRVTVAAGSVDYETAHTHVLDVRIIDGAGRSADIQLPVEVLDLNESPQLQVNQTLPVIAGTTVPIDASWLMATDVDDADQVLDAISYTLTELPTAGTLLLDQSALSVGDIFNQQDLQQGRLSYQHNGAPASADQFGFHLHDGGEDGAVGSSGIFAIEVREPLAFVVDDTWTMLEGESLTLSPAHIDRVGGFSLDTDLYAQVIGLDESIVFLNADTGSVTALFSLRDIADGRVLLRHDGSEQLSASVRFEFQHRDNGNVTVLDTGTIVLDVVDVADAPRGANSEMATDHITALTITEQQLGFDDGDDADRLTAMLITGVPQHGTVELAGASLSADAVVSIQSIRDGALVYRPEFQTSGVVRDVIEFRLIDSGDVSSGGRSVSDDTYNIDIVVSSDHKPIAQPDTVSVEEGGRVDRLDSGASSVSANDTDFDTPASDLLVELLRAPDHGTLVLNENGTFSYQHDGGESRDDSFSYRVADDASDMADGFADVGTVDITIEPRNDIPQAGEAENLETVTNELLRIELPTDLFVDSDIDDNLTLTATQVDGSPLPDWLEFDTETGVFSGVPDGYGVLQISVVATDEAGASAETQFEINIEPLSDAALPAASAPAEQRLPVDTAEPFQPDAVTSVPQTVAESEDTSDAAGDEEDAEQASAEQSGNLLDLNENLAATGRDRLQAFEDLVVKYRRGESAELEVVTANPLLAEALQLQQLSIAMALDALEISELATQKLDRMKDAMLAGADSERVRLVGGVTISAGLSVGYIVWLVRGGLLIGSVMSAMPAWRWIDPLPVLSDKDGVAEEDTESLQTIVESKGSADKSSGIGSDSAAVAEPQPSHPQGPSQGQAPEDRG